MTSIAKIPPDFNFDDIEILKKAIKANTALAELNGLILSLPNYEILLQPLTIREAVASSEIENIRTTTIDILQAEISHEISNLSKEQKETLNYKEALLSGFQRIKKQEFLATNDLVFIQEILEPNKSGIRNQMGTVIADGKGKVIHTPPQEEKEIRDLMKNLDDFINNKEDEIDPLIKMAIHHYQFETIHPFFDGNGRTGRIAMILYLILAGRLRYPALFLSGYILQNKADYYRLLQQVREKNSWKEWILFILEGVAIQSRESSQKILAISHLKKHWKEILKTNYAQIYSVEILDYLFSQAFYTQTNMSSRLSISRPTSIKYLEIFEKEGLMKEKRVGKERLFYISAFLEALQ